jgi:dihydrodipicolinate synthase/N-acetylneuraminate lyase
MANKKYSGVIIPTVTPLTASFALDVTALEKMFAHFYAYDVLPFILGTTGEAASFSIAFKINFLQEAGKLKKPNTLLYAGISSNCIEESIALAAAAKDAGVDVVVATIPNYYALTEEQTIHYFETLANASALPLIIYNIPATTHVSLSLNVIDTLSKHPNIVGCKDSERSDERLAQSLHLWKDRKDFSFFVGWAARSAPALLAGADGIIPSTGNVVASIYKKMIDAVTNGDETTAQAMQVLSDKAGAVYQEGKTLGQTLWALKTLMHHYQLCAPYVQAPLLPMHAKEAAVLIQNFEKINFNS